MKIRSIYLGSWTPKTLMHLKEFENFLLGKKVSYGLDMESATKLYLELEPDDVEIGVGADGIKFVKAKAHGCELAYSGDGLLVMKKNDVDLHSDKDALARIFEAKVAPVFAFLYSHGARGLEIVKNPEERQPLILRCAAKNEAEMHDFIIMEHQEVHAVRRYKECVIYYGDDVIFILERPNAADFDIDRLVEYLLLFSEVKRIMYSLLQTHRSIWDESERMTSEQIVKVKDLPRYSKVFTDFSNTVDNIIARLDQMQLNFNYRVEKARKNKSIFPKLEPNFENIGQNLDYVKNLFAMTRQHLQNNISQISNIYQENQENALNKLQVLFLLSAVSAFMALGSYIPQDPSVSVEISNNFIGFNFGMLLRYGSICIILTAVIYYLWNYTFKNVQARLRK